MKIGVFYFPVDYGINIAELAAALEERGFESLFVPEHTHIPVSRKTPFPSGGELPKRYAHTHDPFVALSFAAAVTKKLRLGTGIAPHSRARPDRHRQGGRHASTSCRAAASSSASAAAGTSRRWKTTAPATTRASS